MKKQKSLVFLTVLLLVGILWGLVMYFFIPSWWFPAYAAIPASFIVICVFENIWITTDDKKDQKWMNSLIAQRLVRWGVLLATLILLVLLAHPPKLSLLVSFMGLFLIYMLLTIFSLYAELRKKQRLK
ncbi:MAG: hypothetical protein GX877_05440 [Bacteroidales bacterium]|nr:hypothetical protein [Bacteroidales bacterium]